MNDYSYFLTPTVIAATLPSVALIAVDTAVVLRYTTWANRTLPRWVEFRPALAFLLLVAHVIANITFNPIFVFMAIPFYVATLLLVIAGIANGIAGLIRRLRKRLQPIHVCSCRAPLFPCWAHRCCSPFLSAKLPRHCKARSLKGCVIY